MRLILFIFLLSFTCQANIPPDKLKHAAVGFGIVLMVGEVTWQLTDRMGLSIFTGLTTSGGATIIKENYYDGKLGKGQKSSGDKVAGFAGAGYGGVTMTVKIAHNIKKENIEFEKYNFKTDTINK